MQEKGFVAGREVKKIVLYALSTCVWCRKAREFLEELGVAFSYYYLDLLDNEERKKILAELLRFNPRKSFPTIVINEDQVIIGYDEGKIRAEAQ